MGQANQPEFKILKDRDGRYYWCLQGASGRVFASSGQTYESKHACEQDLSWLRGNARLIMVYDYTGESSRGLPVWP
jgi:uncharacterized protein YegP (UPF0339 family)